MYQFFIFFIDTGSIFLRLVKHKPGNTFLRFSGYSGIQFFFRKEIIQVHITYHRSFQKMNIFMHAISIISYKHMSGDTHQYRIYIDCFQ